jgi:hypothetical protein
LDTQFDQSHLDPERLRLLADSFQQERAAWASENARIRGELDAERQQLNAEREGAARRMQDLERQEDQHRVVMHAQLSQLDREQQEWVSQRQVMLEDLRREQAEFHLAVRTWAQQSADLEARTTALERRVAQFETEPNQDSPASGACSDEELQAACELRAQKGAWQETQAEEFKKLREEQNSLWLQVEHLRAQLETHQQPVEHDEARAPGPRDFRPSAEHDWDLDRVAEQNPHRLRSSERAAHDQSIEMYMAGLFGRIEKRASTEASDSAPAGGWRTLGVPSKKGAEPASAQEWEDVPAIELPSGPVEMIRRSVETHNLGAMRALANSHATLVLGTHRNRELLRRAVFVWSAALVCVCLTIFVLLIAPANDSMSRTGVMVCAIAAIYFTFSGPLATRRWLATRHRDRKRLRAMVDSINEPSKAAADPSSGARSN